MTDRRLRVCHIIHSLGAGGAEAVLGSLAAASRRVGVETVVIGLSDADDARAVPALLDNGAAVHQLHRGRYDVQAITDVIRLLWRENIDVVHTHLKHADIVGGVAARILSLPAISTLHVIESRPAGLSRRVRLRLATWARAWCFTTIVALSSAQRNWYQGLARKKTVALVPNGAAEPKPTQPRSDIRRSLGVADHEVLALTISLMRPEKGHRVLLEAIRRIDTCLPVRFMFAGDGELLAELVNTVAEEEPLRSRVALLGFRSDIDDLLSAADLVVHPSSEDALPTALIQALAAGRAIVATSVGGIPEIVVDGCGRLVPAHDPVALAEQIAELAADPRLRARYADAARSHYETTYSADVWARRLRVIYDRALERADFHRAEVGWNRYRGSLQAKGKAVTTAGIQSAAIVSAVAPFPTDSGKSVVIAGFLRHLTERLPAAAVHYLHVGEPLADDSSFGDVVVHEMGQPGQLDKLGAVLGSLRPGGQSLQEAFLASARVSAQVKNTLDALDTDLEIIDTIRMSQHVADQLPRGRRVLYLDDLFSVRYRRMLQLSRAEGSETGFDPLGQFAGHVPRPLRRLTTINWSRRVLLATEAKRVERSEIRAAKAASSSVLLNEEEAESLRRATGACVEVIPPWVQSVGGPVRAWHGRPEFVFVGLLSLAHNHDGLSWFLREGMEVLLRERPDAVLHAIGRGAAPSLLAAAERFGSRVRFHGFVEDMDAAIGDACALVNTLRFGSGIKIKTLDALARGIPVVATSYGAEGVSAHSRPGLSIVSDATEAGLALARLADPAIRNGEAVGASEFFQQRFSQSVVAKAYDRVFGIVPGRTKPIPSGNQRGTSMAP
jgi:glycosyltransferase involved in cell wall biosynthesis